MHYSKGKPMNWDQIEVKWAAMARRVRADLPEITEVASEEEAPSTPSADVPEPPLPEIEEVKAG